MSKPNLLRNLLISGTVGLISLIGVQSNAQAGSLFKTTVMVTPTPPNGGTHDGDWFYDVQIIPGTPPKVKLTVKKTPGVVFSLDGMQSFDNDQYLGSMYTYNATESNGKYTFMGNNNGLAITQGMFTPSKMELMIQSPVSTGYANFKITNIMLVPEPTSTLSLLALGTLGAASTLKRKLKSSSKFPEKETIKVS